MPKLSHLALMAMLALGVTALGSNAAWAQCNPVSTACGPSTTVPDPQQPDPDQPDTSTIPDPETPGTADEHDSSEPDEPTSKGDPGGKGKKKTQAVAAGLALDCRIHDETGLPTTGDFWIVNTGATELPAGLKLRYSVPSTGDRGAFLLPRSIAAGKAGKLADFIAETQSGTECRIQIVS